MPVSTLLTVLVARKSQAHFTEQWASTGELHSQLEEFFTGHEVIKAFGRQEASAARFRDSNARLSRASARAQYVSGAVQPLMVFVSNLNYIAVAVVGALQVTAGTMTIGGIQAFIQFSRLFSQPMGQIGGMLTLMQSCLASAERVFSLLDAPEIPPETRPWLRAAPASPRPVRKPAQQAVPAPLPEAAAGASRRGRNGGPRGLRARHLQLQPRAPPRCRTSPSPSSRDRAWRSSGTRERARPLSSTC